MNAFEDERSLVRACTEGDPRAWEAFVERYSPFLDACIRKTLLRRRGRYEPPEAEALFQDVFWELFKDGARTLRAFSWKSKLTTYLWVIASRRAAEHAAGPRRGGGDLPLEDAPEPVQASGDPVESAQREEAAGIVRRTLEELPPRDRRILHLYYYEGKSQDEIARLLGSTPAAIGMAVIRGRRKLEKSLGRMGDPEP
jgi:RNA polymerase sigma-70 factor (ECF subfamily)